MKDLEPPLQLSGVLLINKEGLYGIWRDKKRIRHVEWKN